MHESNDARQCDGGTEKRGRALFFTARMKRRNLEDVCSIEMLVFRVDMNMYLDTITDLCLGKLELMTTKKKNEARSPPGHLIIAAKWGFQSTPEKTKTLRHH